MELSAGQQDALTELINIGYGRAASALSQLTGYRITLDVPNVTMHEIHSIIPTLGKVVPGTVVSVNQTFDGPISGVALLLLDEAAAISLNLLLTDERSTTHELDMSAREVITEIGNILLNACLGVFGNLLQIHIRFSVPRLEVESVEKVLHQAGTGAGEKPRYGLMVHTRFHLKDRDVSGFLVIILGITSMDRLLHELENWESRQIA